MGAPIGGILAAGCTMLHSAEYGRYWRYGQPPASMGGELSGSVTRLSQRLNERDYVQAHILVYPPSGLPQ